MRKDPGKMWTRITPNTDTFYAVNTGDNIIIIIIVANNKDNNKIFI